MEELVTTEEKEGILFVRIIYLLFLSPVSSPVFVHTKSSSTLLNSSHSWLSGPADEPVAMESNPSYTWKFVHGVQHKELIRSRKANHYFFYNGSLEWNYQDVIGTKKPLIITGLINPVISFPTMEGVNNKLLITSHRLHRKKKTVRDWAIAQNSSATYLSCPLLKIR